MMIGFLCLAVGKCKSKSVIIFVCSRQRSIRWTDDRYQIVALWFGVLGCCVAVCKRWHSSEIEPAGHQPTPPAQNWPLSDELCFPAMYLNTLGNSPPSFESNVSRKLSVSDLIPVAGGGCVPLLAQLVGLVGAPVLPGGFMSSKEEGVAGAPSVPPAPVGVAGVLVSQLFSPFTEFVFTLGGPSGSCLMGGGLPKSPPSPSSLVIPGPREVRLAFASAATVLFSFFIAMQNYLRHRTSPSSTIPACPTSVWKNII